MAPAGAARQKKRDEIPIAHRTKGAKAAIQWGYKALLMFTGLIFFLTIFFLRSTPFKFYFLKSRSLPSDLESKIKDGRLLGHFKYEEAEEQDLISVYPGLKLNKDTYASLKRMREAAELEGIQLVLLSGFRSHALQKEIFFDIKSIRNQTASERARVSAPPGYSEHSTGYAVDLGDAFRRETDFEVEFENTPAFRWLQRNAARFHFVLSFPYGNKQGVSYEPWHWRFEGTADALREFEPSRRFTPTNSL